MPFNHRTPSSGPVIARLLPVVVFIGLVTSCTEPNLADGLGERVRVVVPTPDQRIATPSRYGIEKQERAIRDSMPWRLTWEYLIGPTQPPPAVPLVDFQSSMVVLLSLGTRGTPGYNVMIDSLSVHQRGAVVFATERAMGNDCVQLQVAGAPTTAVKIPNVDGDIRFQVTKRIYPCSR